MCAASPSESYRCFGWAPGEPPSPPAAEQNGAPFTASAWVFSGAPRFRRQGLLRRSRWKAQFAAVPAGMGGCFDRGRNRARRDPRNRKSLAAAGGHTSKARPKFRFAGIGRARGAPLRGTGLIVAGSISRRRRDVELVSCRREWRGAAAPPLGSTLSNGPVTCACRSRDSSHGSCRGGSCRSLRRRR